MVISLKYKEERENIAVLGYVYMDCFSEKWSELSEYHASTPTRFSVQKGLTDQLREKAEYTLICLNLSMWRYLFFCLVVFPTLFVYASERMYYYCLGYNIDILIQM